MQHLDEGTLQAWLDRARSGLSSREIELIEQHLAACPECALRSEELERDSRLAASLFEGVRLAADVAPEYSFVVARPRGARVGPRTRRMAWAASVVVALGVGWLAANLSRERLAYAPAPAVGPDGGSDRVSSATPREPPEASPTPAVDPPSSPSSADPADPPDEPIPDVPSVEAPTLVVSGPEPTRSAEPIELPTVILDSSPVAAAPPAPAERREASTSWTVVGRVTDDAGTPIPAAQVFIADLDVGVLTQQDGSFRLSWPRGRGDPAARDVTLTVQRIGYRQQTRELLAMSGEPVTADFGLVEEALALDEVVVTGRPGGAQRRAIGNTVTVPSSASGWRPVGRAAAEAEAGFDMLTVQDLPLLGIEVGGEGAVRVLQSLDGEGMLTLIERRGEAHPEDRAAPNGQRSASTRVGAVTVTAVAPLSADSLRTLLDRLR